LPFGVTFTDTGDVTATLACTPTPFDCYPLTFTASNGVSPNATQSFTLTVIGPPAITSADHATFSVGSAGSFTVTTTAGNPATTSSEERRAGKYGVTLTANGD